MSVPDPGNLFKSYTTNALLTGAYHTLAGVDYASDSGGTNSGIFSPAYLWYAIHNDLNTYFTDTPAGLDAMLNASYLYSKDADGIILNCLGDDFPFRYVGNYVNMFIVGQGIFSIDKPRISCTLNYPAVGAGWPPPYSDGVFFEFANQYLGMNGDENYSSFASNNIDWLAGPPPTWPQSMSDYDNGLIGGFIPTVIDPSNLTMPAFPNGGLAFWAHPLQGSDNANIAFMNTGILKTARIAYDPLKVKLSSSGIAYSDLKDWVFPSIPPATRDSAFSMSYPPINPGSTDILIPQHTIPPLKRRIPFQNYTQSVPRMIKK